MPGKFIVQNVNSVVKPRHYDYYSRNYVEARMCFTPSTTDENTYITIFGYEQDDILKFFLANYKGKIVHVSEKSINGRENHGTYPRNTVVVYEAADSVQQVPTV